MAKLFDVGDHPILKGNFADRAGDAVDPASVKCYVQKPSQKAGATFDTYTYPSSSEMSKTGTGAYECEITIDEPGRWYFYYEGTGSNEAVEPYSFLVRTPVFSA